LLDKLAKSVKNITKDTPLDDVIKIVTGNLPVDSKIPIPQIYYKWLEMKFMALGQYEIDYLHNNFIELVENEYNSLGRIIPMIIELTQSCSMFTSESNGTLLIDTLIRTPLEIFCNNKITIRRNNKVTSNLDPNMSSKSSSKGGSSKSSTRLDAPHLDGRPDLVLYNKKFLMLLGEEKGDESQENDALTQLLKFLDKTQMIPTSVFGNIPCIFAYTACGKTVKLFYFTRYKKIHSIKEFNISLLFDRISLFIHIVNIARALTAFETFLMDWPYGEDLYKPIKRDLGSYVTLCYGGVRKIYKKNSLKYTDAKRMHEIYNFVKKQCQSVPAIRCLEIYPQTINDNKTSHFNDEFELCLAPLCAQVDHYLPKFKDLVCALINVIRVLIMLHENKRVHGDIRWSNIMINLDDGEFVVIDFDNGGQSGRILTDDECLMFYPKKEMKQG
jgi:hypothetical protein